jgi:hypothetical protein
MMSCALPSTFISAMPSSFSSRQAWQTSSPSPLLPPPNPISKRVDFCAPRRKLIIELDGSQHLQQEEYDAERTKYLESLGYRVLRFWNHDMNKMEEVLHTIWNSLNE